MQEITKLDGLMGGAINERFEAELAKLLSNVFDPNTDAKKTRELAIKIVVRPNAKRDGAEWTADVQSKLAPHKPNIKIIA